MYKQVILYGLTDQAALLYYSGNISSRACLFGWSTALSYPLQQKSFLLWTTATEKAKDKVQLNRKNKTSPAFYALKDLISGLCSLTDEVLWDSADETIKVVCSSSLETDLGSKLIPHSALSLNTAGNRRLRRKGRPLFRGQDEMRTRRPRFCSEALSDDCNQLKVAILKKRGKKSTK